MNTEFEKSFAKSLKKISDKRLLPKIEKIILECESVETLEDIRELKIGRIFKFLQN